MGKPSRTREFRTKTFVAGLRNALRALPTESEKNEMQASCTALIEFLSELQKKLNALPSFEDMEGVRRTIEKVEDFLSKAETDPVLGAVVGLRRARVGRRSRPEVTEDESTRAKAALANLESLPIDEIEPKLANEDVYSVRELRAIASEMGIRSTKGLNRVGLAHQIATKIANYRGYQSLSGSAAGTNT